MSLKLTEQKQNRTEEASHKQKHPIVLFGLGGGRFPRDTGPHGHAGEGSKRVTRGLLAGHAGEGSKRVTDHHRSVLQEGAVAADSSAAAAAASSAALAAPAAAAAASSAACCALPGDVGRAGQHRTPRGEARQRG